jgi:hypothetical protein
MFFILHSTAYVHVRGRMRHVGESPASSCGVVCDRRPPSTLATPCVQDPWRRLFPGNLGKSPVKDPIISKRLGLKPGSMHVLLPR